MSETFRLTPKRLNRHTWQTAALCASALHCGEAIIAWKTHAGQVQAVSGTTLGDFGVPVTLGSGTRNAFPPVQVALDEAGAASLVWRANSTSHSVATRTPGGTWSVVTQLPGA